MSNTYIINIFFYTVEYEIALPTESTIYIYIIFLGKEYFGTECYCLQPPLQVLYHIKRYTDLIKKALVKESKRCSLVPSQNKDHLICCKHTMREY